MAWWYGTFTARGCGEKGDWLMRWKKTNDCSLFWCCLSAKGQGRRCRCCWHLCLCIHAEGVCGSLHDMWCAWKLRSFENTWICETIFPLNSHGELWRTRSTNWDRKKYFGSKCIWISTVHIIFCMNDEHAYTATNPFLYQNHILNAGWYNNYVWVNVLTLNRKGTNLKIKF